MNRAILCGLLCLWSVVWGPMEAWAKPVGAYKVDHLALAAVLLRDGHLKRAQAELKLVRLGPKTKRARRARYHMLQGVIELKLGAAGASVRSFQAALRFGLKHPLLPMLMAQGYFRLAQYQRALAALAKAPPASALMPGRFLLESQSYWRLGRLRRAYRVLVDGRKHHPGVLAMLRLQALLLIDLKLSQAALPKVRDYLQQLRRAPHEESAGASGHVVARREAMAQKKRKLRRAYLMFAGAFRKQKLLREAALVLEELRLLEPGHVPTLVQMARVYLESGQTRAAAALLMRAAWRRPKLMVEAAELYRRAGQLWQALYLNAQIVSQKPKIRQRLGLLIELRRWEEAVALVPRLSRLGLLQEQAIVYAIAYAFYQTGHYKRADLWLSRISAPAIFEKAIQLRKAMQSCANREWWCP